MEIGIGYPQTMPTGRSDLILEWAQRVDAGPFSCLGVIDRLVYGNHEPLVMLAAAAAVTDRVRLMTAVLIAPLRNAALLAKQVASIDAISGGRLVLGLGVGSRPDDFVATSAPLKGRGRLFEEQLDLMKRVWSGQPLGEGVGPVGPTPARQGGPEILIGGRSPVALERAGRLGDGYIAGGAGSGTINEAREVLKIYKAVEESWKAAGRPGRPRLVGSLTCALGEYAAERTRAAIRAYYGFRGPAARAGPIALPSTPQAIKDGIKAYEDIGMDELILRPGVADLDQLERLTDLVG
jgi:alkanesulfonate monooxygenase SsuD/methylene tetrahydromethanopterin reductase-like flavin-dependent oxidoreductase (luciferase family)